jgi:Icc-related predicted phosphoesterase
MLPRLLLNRINYGRSLDILITHSPPFGIHDEDSQAHQGLKAINWLIRVAKPRYHFHGHTHFQRGNLSPSESTHDLTKIINVFPYKIIEVSH